MDRPGRGADERPEFATASVQHALKLDAHRLDLLKAVVDHGSMSRAALELGFSPSAVSQNVAALERIAGVPLLTRHARGVHPTAAGALLVRHAEALRERLDVAADELDALVGARGGAVRAGMFASAAVSLLPAALALFRVAFPGVELSVVERDADESARLLADGELDIAVVFDAADAPELVTSALELTPVVSDPFRVLLPAGHGHAGRPAVAVAALASDAWILPRGAACAAIVLSACERAGFRPRVAMATDDYGAARGLVGARVGVAVIPGLLGLTDDATTVVRDLEPAPAREVLVAVRRQSWQPPAVSGFRDAIIAAAAAAPAARPQGGPLPSAPR